MQPKLQSFFLLLAVLLAFPAAAAEPPVRLAILVENPAAMTAGDLLTVALSKEPQIALLERAQINQVLREQALSTANGRDYLKLGEILGADGLLIMEVIEREGRKLLSSRLVAVKSGVALAVADYDFPLAEPEPWSRLVAKQFASLFPKLGVLPRDAVPISLLHLRSAIQSPETGALEHELNLLLLSRLMHEKEIFVLERQKLDELAGEKELKGLTNTAFWNGSYVLDGTIDRDGYNREMLTLSARLAPPGKPAVNLEVRGKRSESPVVINDLVSKILIALRKEGASPDWKPADEAAQYYEEGGWAFKWGMVEEAVAAAESAWALGKKDLDCALLRQKIALTRLAAEPEVLGRISYEFDYTEPGKARIRELHGFIGQALSGPEAQLGSTSDGNNSVFYTGPPPNPKRVDLAVRVLRLYDDFCRILPSDQPVLKSPWYQAGAESLIAASGVLQAFYYLPAARASVEDQLAALRASARSVAARLSQTPSARRLYWPAGDSPVGPDYFIELSEAQTVFKITLVSGSLWQDQPENSIELYRELMAGAAYSYLNDLLWNRIAAPRLTAWKANDAKRIPALWKDFKQQLHSSTNLYMQIEAGFLELGDAGPTEKEAALDAAVAVLFAHHDELVTNYVRTGYGGYRVIYAIPGLLGNQDALKKRYSAEYAPRLAAINGEWQQFNTFERPRLLRFGAQKQYLLTNHNGFDLPEFWGLFSGFSYTKAQAAEIQPLFKASMSNFIAKFGTNSPQHLSPSNSLQTMQLTEMNLERALNGSDAAAKPPVGIPVPATAPRTNTGSFADALTVTEYFKLPVEKLHVQDAPNYSLSQPRIHDGRLWLDFRYYYFPSKGDPLSDGGAVAALNPENGAWEFFPYPPPDHVPPPSQSLGVSQLPPRSSFQVFNGTIYAAVWDEIKKCDLPAGRWESLNLPHGKNIRLSTVHDRLYGANEENIFEILNGGQTTRLLASCRRRPAVTALDSLDSLGLAVLFAGPGKTLRAFIGGKIYSWDGRDWNQTGNPPFRQLNAVSTNETVWRGSAPAASGLWQWQRPDDFWVLPNDQSLGEFSLRVVSGAGGPADPGLMRNRQPDQIPAPPRQIFLRDPAPVAGPMAVAGSQFYFYADSSTHFDAGRRIASKKEGRDADLFILEPGSSNPISIPLKFDSSRGPLPCALPAASARDPSAVMASMQPRAVWMLLSADRLFIGCDAIPGVWSIPRRDLDLAITRQKQAELAKETARQTLRQAALSRFDLDHNGRIDPAEKAGAIDEAAFIEAELDEIDANHNGLLDSEESAFFDTDQNGHLNPRALAGLQIAGHLLAVKLFQEFDDNHDGRITADEYFYHMECHGTNLAFLMPLAGLASGSGRPGSFINLEKWEESFNRRTLAGLNKETSLQNALRLLSRDTNVLSNTNEFLKARFEAYWGSVADRKAPSKAFPVGSHPGQNGGVDIMEKESAISNPDFLESQLEMIDTNHNLWLELPELSYFDLNRDGILDPAEQAAMQTTERLLAAKIFSQFDDDGDGYLDGNEYRRYTMLSGGGRVPLVNNLFRSKRKLTLDDLVGSFEAETLWLMRAKLPQGHPLKSNSLDKTGDPRAIFKATLEACWKEPSAGAATGAPGDVPRPPAAGQSVPH